MIETFFNVVSPFVLLKFLLFRETILSNWILTNVTDQGNLKLLEKNC